MLRPYKNPDLLTAWAAVILSMSPFYYAASLHKVICHPLTSVWLVPCLLLLKFNLYFVYFEFNSRSSFKVTRSQNGSIINVLSI